jgi:hypothetical protein
MLGALTFMIIYKGFRHRFDWAGVAIFLMLAPSVVRYSGVVWRRLDSQ